MTTRRRGEEEATVPLEEGGGGEREAEESSLPPPPPPPPPREGDLLGRHRLSAAISRLNQEIQYLQKELEELDTTEASSATCREVLVSTEGLPDALLPVTVGPENASWDRWFKRVRSSRGHKWWAHKGSDLF